MHKDIRSRGFLSELLAKTGGRYIAIAVVFSQAAASITLFLGFISEQLNADYAPELGILLYKIYAFTIPLITFLLLVIALILSRKMRTKLSRWKRNPEFFEAEDNEEVWKDSHSLVWKYALSAAILSIGFIVIPKTLLLSSIELATEDQVIYGLISGMVSIFAFVPLSTVILDRLLAPVRQVFLPKEFSKQLYGLGKLNILNKTLAVVFFSLIITALLIAPIGYHQTTRALFYDIGSHEVLIALQIQSVAVSGLAIMFAFGLTFLFVKSISDPLAQLMDAFSKVESGDLTTRAPVVSSDEISEMAIYFNRMVSRLQELQSDLEKKVDERTSQLKAINEVGRVATSILDPEELLKRVVNLITQEFGYYYSALYLIDNTGQWCDLKAATGEAGRVLLESKHQVEINNINIIGKSIRTREAQIFDQSAETTIRPNNSLLPYTRSELSLPLLVGDQILGALDVHSTQDVAFNEQDIETLQNMANQVAISLDNARLFQETRQRLTELRNIQKQYLREAWIDSNLPQSNLSLAIGDDTQGEKDHLAEFPITLRDQTIGQLMLSGDEPLSEDDKSWIRAIATQTALALENTRLLEESQSVAIREKFVTEITNKIWSSTSIDGVLQTTIRELGQILDATEATIEINVDENRGI
jgi:GAF domain-containing protein/HAMP domain-containing protein